MRKWLSKYIAAFDCFRKTLFVLSGTSVGVSTAWFADVIGAPVGILSTSFSFAFSMTTKLLWATKKGEKAW